MAKQTINIGSAELAGDGESLRSAFDKINDNFDEVYAGSGTTLGSDTSPALGGNLDLSGNDITGIGNLNITGNITATGSISASLDYSNLTNTPTTLAGYGITDALTAGGALSGDLTGSVFADDSTVLVDGVNGTLNATTLTGALPAIDGSSLTGITTAFSNITSTPTTISGYGITDAQAALVSGTNIKTVNGESLLGSGNITITGGGGGGSSFTNIGIGADDSTIRTISEGESFLILGGTGITTASDAEGNITITGFDGAFGSLSGTPTTLSGYGISDAYTKAEVDSSIASVTAGYFDFNITGDDSTVRTVSSGSTIGIVGGTGITTASDADGNITITASGGGGSGLQSRSTATGTTTSLADAAEADLDITGFKSYALLTITTDRAARVRLYVSAATRTADASRAEGVDPTSDAGLIAEVITTGADTVIISPGAFGFNLESSPTTTIPCRVTNKSGGTSTVQVDLNILQLEA